MTFGLLNFSFYIWTTLLMDITLYDFKLNPQPKAFVKQNFLWEKKSSGENEMKMRWDIIFLSNKKRVRRWCWRWKSPRDASSDKDKTILKNLDVFMRRIPIKWNGDWNADPLAFILAKISHFTLSLLRDH